MRSIVVLRGSAVVLGGVGAFVVTEGFQLTYYGLLGPGPGFFPIWLGAILVGACLLLLVHSFFARHDPERFFLSPEAAVRVLALVLSLAAVWIMLELLGFRLAILLFALFVPRIFDRQSPITTAVVALIAGFGVAFAFETWLQVRLPGPAFELLESIGL